MQKFFCHQNELKKKITRDNFCVQAIKHRNTNSKDEADDKRQHKSVWIEMATKAFFLVS